MKIKGLFVKKTASKPRGLSETFNLRRYLTIYSLLIIVLSMVPLSLLVIHKQKNLLVNSEISSSRALAHQLTHRLYDEDIIPSSEALSSAGLMKESLSFSRMDRIIKNYLREFADIKKIEIFSTNGQTVYSTGSEEIVSPATSEGLITALNGHVSSNLTKSMKPIEDGQAEDDKLYEIDILEIYVPILAQENTASQQSRVIGVFKIYENMSPIFAVVKRETAKIYSFLMLSIAVLILFLHLVARKAHSIIQKKDFEIRATNMELREAQRITKDYIDEVIEHKSFHVRYNNPGLLNCWEVKKCEQKQCPSFGSDKHRCWQVAGTFCGGRAQGLFAQKYGDCKKCEVYKHAINSRINVIGESFNNMMALLEQEHTEVEKANEKLNQLIDIDPLTQIGNRRSFQKRIESIHLLSLRYHYNYSFIICDIDNFKKYNDTYGHQKGDYVLISVAGALKKAIRRTDEVFRWGGEEFVVILPEQNLQDALLVAENLRHAVQSLRIEHMANPPGIVTISCGAASSSAVKDREIGWESLLKYADDALYTAKEQGRNRVCSSEDAKQKS